MLYDMNIEHDNHHATACCKWRCPHYTIYCSTNRIPGVYCTPLPTTVVIIVGFGDVRTALLSKARTLVGSVSWCLNPSFGTGVYTHQVPGMILVTGAVYYVIGISGTPVRLTSAAAHNC